MLLIAASVRSQHLVLKAGATSPAETAIIDSVGYPSHHPNLKSVESAVDNLRNMLRKDGFIATTAIRNTPVTDTIHEFEFNLGAQVQHTHLYIGAARRESGLFPDENDTLKMPFRETEPFLKTTLGKLERKGYALAKVRLTGLQQKGTILCATLEIDTGAPRTLQDVIVNGYDKFPEGHRRQLARSFRNKPFSQTTLKRLYDEVARFRFMTQTKYPEVLLTTDSTKAFLYAEKAKANRFDGFLGFSNDEQEGRNKVRLNGYLDLLLVNILNTGEEFSLFWKSDGNDQKTFNAAFELPYIFKSRLALKGSLQIFRQDSTFQNTRTHIALGYLFDYGMRAYAGYESTESSDIQNTTTAILSDFKSRFATATFSLVRYRDEDFLFPEKTQWNLRTGIGSRTSKLQTNGQWYIDLSGMYNLYLNEKNIINLRTRSYYMNSAAFLISELHRFGGINSVRGFNENSLQANITSSLLAEYRYVLAPGLYAHSIIDYGWMRDETRAVGSKNNALLGLGFGLGILSRNGLFNLVYANGSTNDQSIELRNSIVHVSFKSRF